MADDQELISIADYELAARTQLAPGALAYLDGGAGDEITLRDNVAAWRRLVIRPRPLVPVGRREYAVTVLNKTRPNPLIVAPMAFQRLAHPDGEVGTAIAAAHTNAIMCLSTYATTTPAALAEAVPEVARWFQLYVFTDRGVTRELIAQATEHGYEALVVTVDLPVLGIRERELRTKVEADVELVASAGAAGASGSLAPAQFTELIDPNLSWTDIEQLAAETRLPVIVKGVITAEAGRLAAAHGARGLVVSNHGGRQLDTVLAGADALPEVVEAVGDQLDVLVDGGIRRGSDVVKALALGARAVMVGRPVLWGLAVQGTDGARRVLELLLSELDIALALAGAPKATDLDSSFLGRAPWAAEAR